jgi:MFS family permease
MAQPLVAPAAAAAVPLRNPFASPNYKRWWTASVLVGLGAGIQLVTVPLFVRDRVEGDYTALALAAALICQTLPSAFLVLFGGVVADRVDRRRILVRTYGVAAVVSTLYILLATGEIEALWPVFPLAMTVGAANAFTQPARQAMVPQIVEPSQLQNAVILGTVAFMVAFQFGGPAIGGFLADGPGLATAFAFEAVLLGAGVLIFQTTRSQPPTPSGRDIRGDLADGVHYARGSPAILSLLLIATLPGLFFVGPMNVDMVLVVDDVLDVSDKYVGLLYACFGAGIAGMSVLMTLLPLRRRGLVLCLSPIYGGIVFILFGASETLAVSMIVLAFFGVGAALFINMAVALLQEYAEPAKMGRVMSMYSLAFLGSAPLGYLQAGIVTSIWGPQAAIMLSGAIIAVIGVLCLVLLKPVRSLE